jgi:hypothetical protein
MTAFGSTSAGAPIPGAQVLTADGKELGRVKEVSGTCFKVDVSLRPDYWLASSYVSSATSSEVRLTVTKDNLDTAKVDGPGHAGIHGHGGGTTVV